MKLHVLLVIGLAAGIVGCAEKEQAASEQGTEVEPTESAVTEAPAVEPEAISAKIEGWRNEAFLGHMHAHAEQLDDLNFALDDGNLEQAMTPAYWLSRHESASGLPTDLQPFLERMRAAARSVEEAEDLEAARAAAERIGVECQGCHTAVGVNTP